jgi:tripartite-type tricarboxylate transporter receptor subunit TctC
MPDLPTLAESGLPGYNVGTWWGLMAPAGTPRPVIDRLASAMKKAVAAPSIRERFIAGGIDPKSSAPDEFAAMVKAEVAHYRELANAAGVEPM